MQSSMTSAWKNFMRRQMRPIRPMLGREPWHSGRGVVVGHRPPNGAGKAPARNCATGHVVGPQLCFQFEATNDGEYFLAIGHTKASLRGWNRYIVSVPTKFSSVRSAPHCDPVMTESNGRSFAEPSSGVCRPSSAAPFCGTALEGRTAPGTSTMAGSATAKLFSMDIVPLCEWWVVPA